MDLSFRVEPEVDGTRFLTIYFKTKHSNLSWEYEDCIFRGYPETVLVDVDYLALEMSRIAEKVWASIPLTQYDLGDLHSLISDMHHHFLGVMSSDLTFGEFLDILSENKEEIENAKIVREAFTEAPKEIT